MAGNIIYITDAGRAALVAPGNTGTNAHQVTQIGIGTSAFKFDKGMTALPGERKRIATFGGKNISPDTIHVTLQDSTNDQYTMYAFGLYLESGVLLGVYVQDTPILEKSPVAQLLLSADMQFTTIDAAALVFGDASFLNPPATENQQGVIEIATQDETNAGQDDSRALTPKKAATRYAALTGAKFTGPVVVRVDPLADTGQYRAVHGDYGAFWRNDGANAYLLSTKKGDPNGTWNDYRPLAWNLETGFVTIDGNGRGAGFGGNVNVAGELTVGRGAAEGRVLLGPNGGYFFANSEGAGYYLPNVGIFEYLGKDKTLRVDGHAVFHDGNLNPLDKDKGGDIKADVAIRNGDAEMRLRLGPLDGYWYGSKETWGFWSEKFGALQYFVADKSLRVDGKRMWHEGNLTPLDVTKGGVINGDVAFAKRPTWAGGLVPFDTGNFDPSTKVNRSGDTMTGPLTLASDTDYSPLILSAKGYTPRIQADNSSSSILVANSANNAVNLRIYDSGQVSTRSNLTVGGTTYAGGSNATIDPDGNIWGSQWGGWLRGFLDNTFAHKSGDTFAGRVTLSANAWQADLCLSNRRPGQNVSTYLRARDGGGLEIINNAYNGVPWNISDAGETWQQNALHVGPVTLQTDGNLYLPFRNRWLNSEIDAIWNDINRRATAGARVQWDSGVNNFGTVDRLGGALPAPWVVCGLSGPGNGTANAIAVYGVQLRNQ